MEKRRSKRLMIDRDAHLVSRSLNYEGKIRNLSDDGIGMVIHSEQNICQLLNGMRFEVKFALPSGEETYIQCEIIRTHRRTAHDMENRVGMKIINKPPEYREFLQTLY